MRSGINSPSACQYLEGNKCPSVCGEWEEWDGTQYDVEESISVACKGITFASTFTLIIVYDIEAIYMNQSH